MMTEQGQLRLLIIEDNDDDAELILQELRRGGLRFEHERVQGEAQLREALGALRPDVVLSDYSMPGFSGHAALRVVRDTDEDLPFVYVSGTIGEDEAIDALKHGATDYVLKHNLSRLAPAVRRAVEEAQLRKARREAEERVHEMEARFRQLVESVQDYAIFMLDEEGSVMTWNVGAQRISGYTSEEIMGKHYSHFFSWTERSENEPQRQLEIAANEGRYVEEGWRLRKDGTRFWALSTISAVRNPDGSLKGFAGVVRDVTERKTYEDRIVHLANYDPLTDLPNRNLLTDRFEQAMAYARRAGRMVAVMILDLDQFKFVNDSLGHPVGDSLLRLVGRKIDGLVRDGDTVCRLGGDEFVVLLTDVARSEDVVLVANKVLEAFSEPFAIEGEDLFITASIGISLFPRDGDDCNVLLKAADAAMYRAKKQGRNGFRFHTQDMVEEVHDHLRLDAALRKALHRGEFELHYQPQVELASGRVVGVEALIRWQHPEYGLVSPGRFIPLAEETGLIVPIGEWVLHEACRWNRACQDHGLPPIHVAVNLSVRQLTHEGFARTVEKVLADTALDPRCLELELTESMMMHNADWLLTLLRQLRRTGVRMSIDDFGTGYSSLNYLKRFPIDRIKIDQTFVRHVTEDRDDASICAAVISLAHNLNMRAIAEGVETRSQQELLRRHGCDEIQGYYISRPIPGQQCETFVLSWLAGAKAFGKDGGSN